MTTSGQSDWVGQQEAAPPAAGQEYFDLHKRLEVLCEDCYKNMQTEKDYETIQAQFVVFSQLLGDWQQAAADYRMLAGTRSQTAAMDADYEEKLDNLMKCREDMHSFLQVERKDGHSPPPRHHVNTQEVTLDDIRPSDSTSQVSHRSRASRTSSARSSASVLRLKEEQRQAELLTRASAMRKQHDLDNVKRKITRELEEATVVPRLSQK